MRRLLLLAALLVAAPEMASAACTGSGSPWTTTIDRASFEACVDGASEGDTINVSAGSATWTSTVSITKGLIIVGAGTASSVITLGYNGALFTIELASTEYLDISGLGMIHSSTASSKPLIQITISGQNNARIHGNLFETPVSGSSQRGIRVKAHADVIGETQVSMLIDNNTFRCGETSGGKCQSAEIDLCDGLNTVDGTLLAPAHAAMSLPLNPGTNTAVFFEDNTLEYTRGQDGSFEGYGCARVVHRFNTYHGAGFGHHGTDSGQRRGTQWYEYYHNTIDAPLVTAWNGRVAQVRSGNGFAFNNTYTTGVTSGIQYDYFRGNWTDGVGTMQVPTWAGECDGTHAWDGNTGSGTSYPGAGYRCLDAPGQTSTGVWPNITNVWGPNYTFRNLKSGVHQATANGTQAHIASNIDVFDEDSTNCPAAGTSCTAGVGVGTAAQLAAKTTCTLNTGFWVTDEGDWNTDTPEPDGQFYKCNGSNQFVLYYEPYTYPHPLQGGSGDVTNPTCSITDPTSAATYETSTTPLTTLAGTSSDAVGVTQVGWSNDRGGSGVATGTTAWSVASINLENGANVITLSCQDAAGNAGTDTITVTYTPVVITGVPRPPFGLRFVR